MRDDPLRARAATRRSSEADTGPAGARDSYEPPGAPTGAFKLIVGCDSAADPVSATVTFTHVGDEGVTEEMYGGYITYDESAQYMPSLGALHAMAYVWDSGGTPAEGKAALVLPVPMEGPSVWSDQAEYDSRSCIMGIEVTTSADGYCRLASGPLSVPDLYVWDIVPVTLEGIDMIAGEIELTFNQAMDTTTTATAWRMVGPEGEVIPGEITWPSTSTMRFKPDHPLDKETNYLVILGVEAVTAQGVPIDEPLELSSPP